MKKKIITTLVCVMCVAGSYAHVSPLNPEQGHAYPNGMRTIWSWFQAIHEAVMTATWR